MILDIALARLMLSPVIVILGIIIIEIIDHLKGRD